MIEILNDTDCAQVTGGEACSYSDPLDSSNYPGGLITPLGAFYIGLYDFGVLLSDLSGYCEGYTSGC